MFSFIELEVASMNENVVFEGENINLEPFELEVLKEIDTFNENKSIDFNFNIKQPVSESCSLNLNN